MKKISIFLLISINTFIFGMSKDDRGDFLSAIRLTTLDSLSDDPVSPLYQSKKNHKKIKNAEPKKSPQAVSTQLAQGVSRSLNSVNDVGSVQKKASLNLSGRKVLSPEHSEAKLLDQHIVLRKKEIAQQKELIKQQKRIADAQELRTVIKVLLSYEAMQKRIDELNPAQSSLGKRKHKEFNKISNIYSELALVNRYTQLVKSLKSSNKSE